MLRGYAFNSSADFEVVRQIKEDLCYSKSKLLFIFNSILNSKYKLKEFFEFNNTTDYLDYSLK